MRLEDMDPEGEITTFQCALHHGVSRQAVSLAIKEGRLPARRDVSRNYKVTVSDCLAYEPEPEHRVKGKRGARVRLGLEPATEEPQGGGKPGRKPRYEGPMKDLSIGLPLSLYERIRAEGKARGLTATEVAREALEERFGGER